MGKQRAPRGAGSVFQTTNNGVPVWCASYSYLDTETGKRRFVRGYGATATAAIQRRQQRWMEIAQSGMQRTRTSGPTIREFVDTWLDESTVRESTRFKYRRDMEMHVIPHIGSVKLTNLTVADLKNLFLHQLSDVGTSAQTNVYTNLNTMLNYALKNELLERNPLVNVPRPKHVTQVAKGDDYWHDRRLKIANRLLEAISDPAHPEHHFYPMMLVFMLGLRRGEVLGLTWERIHHLTDNRQCYIAVDQQLKLKPGGGWELAPTKTARRKVPAGDTTRKVLLEMKRATEEERQQRKEVAARALVFVTKTGRAVSYNTLYRWWNAALDSYLSPEHRNNEGYRFRIHYLRHIAASNLANQGVPQTMIDTVIGHSDASTSARYRHMNEEALSRVRAAYEGLAPAREK